jgi:hypothetical protein
MQERDAFPEPSWVVSDEDRHRFRLQIAAVYFSKSGALSDLAGVLGLTRQALYMACTREGISPAQAKVLEETLGRELFPRAFFRPDIFE